MKTKYILALSGNDIFSGGGLHADLTTYTVHGLHGFVAVTCLTAMTEKGFEVIPTDAAVFAQQLASLKDVPFSAIKIGLLPTVEIAEQALEFIKAHQDIPVVLDPVLVCKETHDTEVSQLRDELLKFLPYISIITPNLAEAQLLLQKDIQTVEEMEQAWWRFIIWVPSRWSSRGNRLGGSQAVDVYYDGQEVVVLKSPLLSENNVGQAVPLRPALPVSFARSGLFGSSPTVQGLCPCDHLKIRSIWGDSV